MIRTLIRYGALAAAIGLGACELEVTNPNDPGTDEVLATPKDAEALVGSYYRRWHAGLYGTLSNIWGMANVQSFENYSSLANNGQNARAGIPRPPNDNSIGNAAPEEQHRVYFRTAEVTRVASNIVNQFATPGFTLGSTAQDNRAKAFGEFLRGVSLGYAALFYDSSAVAYPGMSTEEQGDLMGYMVVMDSSHAAMQRAIDYATAPAAGAGGFPLPSSWIPSTTSFTATEFVRLVRSYRARFRAGVARTPTERAAVNWNLVIADAENGITSNHTNITNTTTGPFNTWVTFYHTFGQWHQMTPFIIGMGDVSGAYASWINQPLAARGTTGEFTMVTPDLRFPQGANRVEQQADFAITSCSTASTPCERYFVNRPQGNDQTAGVSWGFSNYDFARFYSWRTSGDGTGQNGSMVFFTKAELDLLAAEGYIRNGDYTSAAALINNTRVPNGLPAVLPTADGGLPGPNCVPKKPVNAGINGGGTLVCGDLMEAMKWEKRVETAYTHFAAWFLDHRGWGDMAEGTPLHWAPPFQDLMARLKPIYSTGPNTTGGAAAAVSTYGW